MDMQALNALSDEQKREYLAMTRTLEDTGWQILSKYFADLADQLTVAGANASSWDENRVMFGKRMAYTEVANLRDFIEARFEQIASEALAQHQDYSDDEDYE